MIRSAALLLAVIASVAVTSTVVAQQDKRGQPEAAPAGFSATEREMIAVYFKENPMEVKPLPPGIAKNLQRGKPLPPGIAKRQLPEALLRSLPARSGTQVGVEITIFGDRIVLLEASGLVVDVIEGVFGT
jgi:hypothetical protein